MATMTRQLERGLIEAGVPEEHAERIADAQEARLSELATKEDLHLLRRELYEIRDDLRRELYEIRDDLRRELAQFREEMNARLAHLERTIWGLAALGFAMWSATFGALMYAVFG